MQNYKTLNATKKKLGKCMFHVCVCVGKPLEKHVCRCCCHSSLKWKTQLDDLINSYTRMHWTLDRRTQRTASSESPTMAKEVKTLNFW